MFRADRWFSDFCSLAEALTILLGQGQLERVLDCTIRV